MPISRSGAPHTRGIDSPALRTYSPRQRVQRTSCKTAGGSVVFGHICLADIGHYNYLPYRYGFLPLHADHMGIFVWVWVRIGDFSTASLLRTMGYNVWLGQGPSE